MSGGIGNEETVLISNLSQHDTRVQKNFKSPISFNSCLICEKVLMQNISNYSQLYEPNRITDHKYRHLCKSDSTVSGYTFPALRNIFTKQTSKVVITVGFPQPSMRQNSIYKNSFPLTNRYMCHECDR